MEPFLLLEKGSGWHRAIMNRASEGNSLTPEFIGQIHRALDDCEHDADARAFILQGSGAHFSSGMDLAIAGTSTGLGSGEGAQNFLLLLKRFSTSRLSIISVVDGLASGGGVGLAAASDFVLASATSRFRLPEVLWGLLPCLIAPFLIRRIGLQMCRRMAMFADYVDAEVAAGCGLIDAVGDEKTLTRLLQRLRTTAPESTAGLKRYLNRLSAIDDRTLNEAIDELDGLLRSSAVVHRLKDYAEHQRLPWEAPRAAVQSPVCSVPARPASSGRSWLFPGQGPQKRGMGADLFDLFPALVETADSILGYSIRSLCLIDPDNDLGKTEFSQPALFIVSALSFLDRRRREAWPDIIAGHSLGEYAALFAAGAFDFETGLRLVQRRGQLMAETRRGSMLAVIGPTVSELLSLVDELSLHELDVASYNLPTQSVMSGPDGAITQLASTIVDRGIGRAVHMHIGGASHGRLAEPVARAFEAELQRCEILDPVLPVISNVTARPYEVGSLRLILGQQMRKPVRWFETMGYMRTQGVAAVTQIGPGRVLEGLWEEFNRDMNSGFDEASHPVGSTA